MAIWNKNAKISGKRINSVVGKAKVLGVNDISLRKSYKDVDEDHYSLIELGSSRNPTLNVDYDGWIDTRSIGGVFGAEEEGEIEVRDDGRLWITMGKNEYWFNIQDLNKSEPNIPDISSGVKATFTMDPSQLAAMAKRADYARFEAGINKDGKRTVLVTFYGLNSVEIGVLDLKTAWKGEPATSMFPGELMSRWDKLGKKAKVRMGSDWPIELTGEDEGVDYRYLLAPRIESDNKKLLPRNKNVVDLDRQRILSIYGTPEKFRREVDSIDAPSVQEAIYAIFASCGDAYPRWMIGDYLSMALGPDYRSFGEDEYDVYARLMARDGMEIYRNAKQVSANRKAKGRKR